MLQKQTTLAILILKILLKYPLIVILLLFCIHWVFASKAKSFFRCYSLIIQALFQIYVCIYIYIYINSILRIFQEWAFNTSPLFSLHAVIQRDPKCLCWGKGWWKDGKEDGREGRLPSIYKFKGWNITSLSKLCLT